MKSETQNRFHRVKLENEQIRVRFMDSGATILSLEVTDRDGNWRDVVLGYESLKDYETCKGYLGAVVGRTANRIRNGQFELNGIRYKLPVNNGPNCNHGGEKGFSFRLFEIQNLTDDSVTFFRRSPDGEEGYPGNLDVSVTYRIKGPELIIEYEATSDADTLFNPTNHSYFNLNGKADPIGNHLLQIQADRFGQVDDDTLFTGKTADVTDTPFDFRTPRRIAEALNSDHPQIRKAGGLDHPFLLSRNKEAVRLSSPESGIALTVSTTCPAAQIYTANFLAGETGKDGQPMNAQTAVCIETSCPADDINLNKEKSATILRKGETRKSRTSFRFETEHESK